MCFLPDIQISKLWLGQIFCQVTLSHLKKPKGRTELPSTTVFPSRRLRATAENLLPQNCQGVYRQHFAIGQDGIRRDHTILHNPHVLGFLSKDPFQISQVPCECFHLPIVERFSIRRGFLNVVPSPDVDKDVFGIGEGPRDVQGCREGYQDSFTFFFCIPSASPHCVTEEYLPGLRPVFTVVMHSRNLF